MRQRTWLTLVGGVLVGGMMLGSVLARAQSPGTLEDRKASAYRELVQLAAEQQFRARVNLQADSVSSTGGQTTFTGVSIKVDGVTVLANRAVIRDGEYQLEGNVRMRLEPPVLPITVQVPVAPTPPTP